VNAAEIVLGDNWGNKKASVMEVGVNKLFLETKRNNGKVKREKLQFVYIGSLAKVRKLEFIIDSIGQLIKQTKNFHLTLIGPDSDNLYHNYVIKNNLQDYISILDPLPYTDIPIMLKNYDVGIAYVPEHPDWHYQPTLKVKEYCALGMPVLATDNLPNRVFVKENETGFFFQNTEEDLCKKILSLINDKVLLDRLMRNSSINRSGRTWSDSARNYEDLFEELAKKV
jgi:glycosyltransferase involved in cell wall biosynthesis